MTALIAVFATTSNSLSLSYFVYCYRWHETDNANTGILPDLYPVYPLLKKVWGSPNGEHYPSMTLGYIAHLKIFLGVFTLHWMIVVHFLTTSSKISFDNKGVLQSGRVYNSSGYEYKIQGTASGILALCTYPFQIPMHIHFYNYRGVVLLSGRPCRKPNNMPHTHRPA